MNLVVYLHPSGGTDPGHMVIGHEPGSPVPSFYGYRFNPLDLPVDFRTQDRWRTFLFTNQVPGDIVDESDYIDSMSAAGRAGYFEKRAACDTDISACLPPPSRWRKFAMYSFNPDTFRSRGSDCYNCVTWAVGLANRMIAGFLTPVREGRVKEVVKQLTPC